MITYWEMAAAMVLHGAVSAELFVDCNGEGFFLLAKFAPILDAIREKNPRFLNKLRIDEPLFRCAAQRYEAILKRVEAARSAREENSCKSSGIRGCNGCPEKFPLVELGPGGAS